MTKAGYHTQLLAKAAPVVRPGPSVIAELGGQDSIRRLTARLFAEPANWKLTQPAAPKTRGARKPRQPRKLKPELCWQICQLWEAHHPMRLIALKLGVSVASVHRVVRSPDRPPCPRLAARRALAARAHTMRTQERYTLREIGRRLGCHTDKVNRLLNEHRQLQRA